MAMIVTLLALGLTAFQMISSQKLLMSTVPYLSVHVALCFLLTLASRMHESASRPLKAWNWLLGGLTVFCFGYILLNWVDIQDRAYFNTMLDLAVGVAVIFLALKYHRNPEKALIVNTNLGGDNAGRGAVLGALLGAAHGIEKFPDRWLSGLKEPLPALKSGKAT